MSADTYFADRARLAHMSRRDSVATPTELQAQRELVRRGYESHQVGLHIGSIERAIGAGVALTAHQSSRFLVLAAMGTTPPIEPAPSGSDDRE